MQAFTITCLITFWWLWLGYSLSFGPVTDTNPHKYYLYGNTERFWLNGMTENTIHQLAPTIPEPVYCVYQLTFAIITAALICGSFADRKLNFIVVFDYLYELNVLIRYEIRSNDHIYFNLAFISLLVSIFLLRHFIIC